MLPWEEGRGLSLQGSQESPYVLWSQRLQGTAASLPLFITYLFASGCLPGYLRQILPERAVSASLSICCPALTTTLQRSREGSKAKVQVWSQEQSFCLLFVPHILPSEQIPQSPSTAPVIPNGTFCPLSTAQTSSLTCHTAS